MASLTTPPGTAAFEPALHARLIAAFGARCATEPVRTVHRDGDAPHFINRLVLETSPYLRQHAHNPVNWYPWSAQAFDEARRANLPVFLSVGYSTCHWCHVMEEESFEDLDIARLLNERYIAIKVDREERPDVDTIYMRAVQSLTKRGGWPMSVWLDAERRPFFAGTYFPARDGERGTPNGFSTIARRLADMYRADPQRIAEAAASITSDVRNALSRGTLGEDVAPASVLETAARFFASVYDDENGGVRGAPKFPSSLPVRTLLRRYHRTGDANALAMAERTLERMAAGGMHDQLAGGFHRYSTDERWLVPHFEKMLYDNALLALAYGEAWQVTQRPAFARVLRTTLDYVLREMTSPEGGFYSATDADSEGEEGTFFVWREAEIRAVLGDWAERFMRFYGVTPEGNFEGSSVLFVPEPNEDEWQSLASARETMRLARERRPRPLRDEKILTAWNGLMISALASGGRILGEARYVAAAARAADFLLGAACRDGRLQRSWKDARTTGPGFLEDDAFAVAALLDTYEATFEARFLAEALRLAARMETLFADVENGGWFRTADDHERLIAREKPSYDGAEPSGSSVALLSALRLATITSDDAWRRIAERAMRCYAAQLREQPAALGEMLLALDYANAVPREIVLVWPNGEGAPAVLTDPLRSLFLPHRALLGAAEGPALAALARLAPVAADKRAQDGRPTVYLCERGACRLPLTEPDAMLAELHERARSSAGEFRRAAAYGLPAAQP